MEKNELAEGFMGTICQDYDYWTEHKKDKSKKRTLEVICLSVLVEIDGCTQNAGFNMVNIKTGESINDDDNLHDYWYPFIKGELTADE